MNKGIGICKRQKININKNTKSIQSAGYFLFSKNHRNILKSHFINHIKFLAKTISNPGAEDTSSLTILNNRGMRHSAIVESLNLAILIAIFV